MVCAMAIRQVPPAEAARELAATPHAVSRDVRTVEEFEAGHPVGARNVAVLVRDPASGRPRPNPEFLAVVQRHLPPATPLLVGCQSGMRSQHACELLPAAGYTELANARGGLGGAAGAAGGEGAGRPRGSGRAGARPR